MKEEKTKFFDGESFFFESEKPFIIKNEKFFNFFFKVNYLSFVIFEFMYKGQDLRNPLIEKRQIKEEHLCAIVVLTIAILLFSSILISDIVRATILVLNAKNLPSIL